MHDFSLFELSILIDSDCAAKLRGKCKRLEGSPGNIQDSEESFGVERVQGLLYTIKETRDSRDACLALSPKGENEKSKKELSDRISSATRKRLRCHSFMV